jgi:hypothetical protein
MSYTYVDKSDALGWAPEFRGPGLPQHCCGVHLMQPMNEWATKHASGESAAHEAERILRLLECAYEAGKRDAKKEIRELLGAAPTETRR